LAAQEHQANAEAEKVEARIREIEASAKAN
jgi:hypothetical protein